MTTVFIDGSAGTTGLKIYERLSQRNDIRLLTLSDDVRKDPTKRKKAIHAADIAFLCLPDAAARESVALAEGSNTVIIDTSTAHRTADGWTYGFPELVGKDAIKNSRRIANPGCHASGFAALVYPLTKNGIISEDALLSCFSLTGYSGGGKQMIAQYESDEPSEYLKAPRMYGLTQSHKHLPEMSIICGLKNAPIFCPVVEPFFSGMQVTVPLFTHNINGSIDDIKDCYRNFYNDGLVRYNDAADENGFLSASAFFTRDDMDVSVYGNNDRIVLVSRFDNLGKGASGAAIQNMNIVLGVDPATGLNI